MQYTLPFRSRLALLFFPIALCTGAISAAELGGSAALTTDYVFRGISQTDENPAVQASFEVGFDNGIHLGIWGSNVDFDADEPSLELDYTAGYAWEWAPGRSLDLGLIYYDYPGGDADEDYLEGYVQLALADFGIGLNYSSDYFGQTDTFWYVFADYSLALGTVAGSEVRADFHIGSSFFDSEEEAGVFFAVPTTMVTTTSGGESVQNIVAAVDVDDSYLDWSVGLSTQYRDFALDLRYHDTDVDSDVCDALCDSRVVFTISRSF